MALRNKDILVATLQQRLGRLDCLALCTKQALIAQFSREDVPAAALANYLDDQLVFVEREIASVDFPTFRDLCLRLVAINDKESLLATLGTSPPFEHENDWLRRALRLDHDWPCCLFALANHFAIPREFDANVDVDAIRLLAESLGCMDRSTDSVRLLEAHLGIQATSYPLSDFRGRLAEGLKGLQRNTAVLFVSTLGESLRFVNRSSDCIRLVETILDLQPEEYSSIDFTKRLRQRLRELTANTAANVVVILGDALRDYERPADSLHLLEAHLRLRPNHYTAVDLAKQLKRRLRDLTARNATSLIISLGDTLNYLDRTKDSVRLLEAHLQLSPDDYSAKDLPIRLSRQLGKMGPNSAASFLGTLGEALGYEDRSNDCVRLIETHLRLLPDDYSTPELSITVATSLYGIETSTATVLVMTLGEALYFASRAPDSVRILESFLDLQPEHYSKTNFPKQLRQRLHKLDLSTATSFIITLADALNFADRTPDGVRLLEAHLGFQVDDYSKQNLAKRLKLRLAGLDMNAAASFISSLANLLGYEDRSADGVRLLESHFQLEPENYSAVDFGPRLIERLNGLAKNTAAAVVGTLGDLLGFEGRNADCVRLIEAYLRLETADYSAVDFAQRLNFRLRDFESNTVATLLIHLAEAQSIEGRSPDSVRLLEAYLQLDSANYSAVDFAIHLSQRLSTFEANTANSLVSTLGEALKSVNRNVDGSRLLEAHLGLKHADYLLKLSVFEFGIGIVGKRRTS